MNGDDPGGADQAVLSVTVASVPPSTTLSDLLADVPDAEVRGDGSTPIAAIGYRSADVTPGSLFFCVPGDRVDGHDFAAEAVERGAFALVVDRWLPLEVAQARVPSVRESMGPIAATYAGHPSDRMTVVGVTGTSGKTTVTYLLEAVLRSAGWTPGVIGTTGVRVDGRPAPLSRTTPEAPDLHGVLAGMAAAGVDAIAMEVSSHGLEQGRVGGIRFGVAVFTNLSQDHLDYHGTMEAYLAAKALLFTPGRSERAVINHDSVEGRALAGRIPTLTFGIGPGADVRATNVETTPQGIAFRVGGVAIRSALHGRFNVENCLAAFAAARCLGVADDVAAEAIGSVTQVPGRLESVEGGQDFLVFVDYAHKPDGVESVLRTTRALTSGRLIVVLGCGGDRDRGKRPLMGRAATANADLAVITSDNPRSEDPLAIIAEIVPGAEAGGGAFVVEPDRRAAIRLAIAEARTGDVVVIAGKGHETYQELSDGTIPFDDRVVASEELGALTKGTA